MRATAMEQTLRFAATKIQPPRARSSRIARPALDAALLPALLSSRVVLLLAAAGFGKTSALAAQLPRLPAGTAMAWVSLDEDDDAQRLFTCLAAALEPHDLPWRTAPEALAALAAPPRPRRRPRPGGPRHARGAPPAPPRGPPRRRGGGPGPPTRARAGAPRSANSSMRWPTPRRRTA